MFLLTKPELEVTFLSVELKNPLVLASGVMGTSPALLERIAISGAGAVTAKSCGLEPREGHPNPVMMDWGHGLLNAIGLTNPGVVEEVALLKEAKARLKPLGVPLIASTFAGTLEEFRWVAEIIVEANPDIVEVNISCPNVHDDFGLPFAASEKSAAEVTGVVRQALGSIPLTVKLAPNVPNIGQIAKAVVGAGADAITAVNTMPGMIINADAGKPVLSNRTGGISGPALKPIALRCVAEIASAVDVPIIGTGGVLTGKDAVEMLMAGASLVGIGSALWYRGPNAFSLILGEIEAFMQEHGIREIADLVGRAL
jgi:dihydroorotate dehydrogenase (NAD+) catalytic subunit